MSAPPLFGIVPSIRDGDLYGSGRPAFPSWARLYGQRFLVNFAKTSPVGILFLELVAVRARRGLFIAVVLRPSRNGPPPGVWTDYVQPGASIALIASRKPGWTRHR